MGVPSHFAQALTTIPYYRSTYVFVSRKDAHLDLRSLEDPALRRLKIGTQLIGNDGLNTPPVHALAARQIITNVVGYTVYGDYRNQSPAARIVTAVANGEIDVALVWGPLGGYFANRSAIPLKIVPIPPDPQSPTFPFAFEISIGVRKTEKDLLEQLNGIIRNNRETIENTLREYGVPLVEQAQTDTTLKTVVERNRGER